MRWLLAGSALICVVAIALRKHYREFPLLTVYLISYVLSKTFADHRQDPNWARTVWLRNQIVLLPLMMSTVVELTRRGVQGLPERRRVIGGILAACASLLPALSLFYPASLDFWTFVVFRQYLLVIQAGYLLLWFLYWGLRPWPVSRPAAVYAIGVTSLLVDIAVAATFDQNGLSNRFVLIKGTLQRHVLFVSSLLAVAAFLFLAIGFATGKECGPDQLEGPHEKDEAEPTA